MTEDEFDKEFPRLAAEATEKAFENALKSGYSVVIARNSKLVKLNPDGTEEFIKAIEKPVKMKKGLLIKIKGA